MRPDLRAPRAPRAPRLASLSVRRATVSSMWAQRRPEADVASEFSLSLGTLFTLLWEGARCVGGRVSVMKGMRSNLARSDLLFHGRFIERCIGKNISKQAIEIWCVNIHIHVFTCSHAYIFTQTAPPRRNNARARAFSLYRRWLPAVCWACIRSGQLSGAAEWVYGRWGWPGRSDFDRAFVRGRECFWFLRFLSLPFDRFGLVGCILEDPSDPLCPVFLSHDSDQLGVQFQDHDANQIVF